jgi:hypothetical protein
VKMPALMRHYIDFLTYLAIRIISISVALHKVAKESTSVLLLRVIVASIIALHLSQFKHSLTHYLLIKFCYTQIALQAHLCYLLNGWVSNATYVCDI